jgi:hypothetical protein
MAYATIDLLFKEVKQMRKELEAFRNSVLPVEELTDAERKEYRKTLAQMKAGKEKNWREAL